MLLTDLNISIDNNDPMPAWWPDWARLQGTDSSPDFQIKDSGNTWRSVDEAIFRCAINDVMIEAFTEAPSPPNFSVEWSARSNGFVSATFNGADEDPIKAGNRTSEYRQRCTSSGLD